MGARAGLPSGAARLVGPVVWRPVGPEAWRLVGPVAWWEPRPGSVCWALPYSTPDRP